MDDIATLRERAKAAARTMQAATERMDALIPPDPMFDPEPVAWDTFSQWSDAYEERRQAEEVFVATMRELIARKSR